MMPDDTLRTLAMKAKSLAPTDDWPELILACLEEHGTCMALGDDIKSMPSLDEAYEICAESLRKTVSELTTAEKQQAFLNAVLRQYGDDDA